MRLLMFSMPAWKTNMRELTKRHGDVSNVRIAGNVSIYVELLFLSRSRTERIVH